MFGVSAGASLAAALYRRTAGIEDSHLYRRFAEGATHGGHSKPNENIILPILFVINVILFLPMVFIILYTFNHVFPALAMVEDDGAEYEPVPLVEDEDSAGTEPGAKNVVTRDAERLSLSNGPVTSSLRATHRLFRANGGFGASSRGYLCLSASTVATGVLCGIFASAMGPIFAPVAVLLASLALVQLSTTWVHIIITRRSSADFWRRLPPFRRTFDATALPTVIYWLAIQAANILPIALIYLLGITVPGMKDSSGRDRDAHMTPEAWKTAQSLKAIVVVIVTIAVGLGFIIPAQTILIRVQASLLPESEDTIVAFDRSFGGAVSPTILGGKGYATVADAWRSLTVSAWRRLLGLYVKIIFVNIFAMLGISLVIGLEFLAISAFA